MAKTIRYIYSTLLGEEMEFKTEVSAKDFDRLLKSNSEIITEIKNAKYGFVDREDGYTYFYSCHEEKYDGYTVENHIFGCGTGTVALRKYICDEGKCFKKKLI